MLPRLDTTDEKSGLQVQRLTLGVAQSEVESKISIVSQLNLSLAWFANSDGHEGFVGRVIER